MRNLILLPEGENYMKIIKNNRIVEKYFHRFPLTDFFSFNIIPFVTVVTFESEEAIFREGDKPEYLYYLIEGTAKLYISHKNGRISLTNFVKAPCFMGEMELIGAQETADGITAIMPCTCYAIRTEYCKEAILNDTRFLRYICLFLSQVALRNSYNYSINQSYPLEVRLARFLLMTSHNCIYKERHTEVSEYLGVTYRHLLYVLAGFVKKEILIKTEQGYYIKDMNALKETARLD